VLWFFPPFFLSLLLHSNFVLWHFCFAIYNCSHAESQVNRYTRPFVFREFPKITVESLFSFTLLPLTFFFLSASAAFHRIKRWETRGTHARRWLDNV